MFVQRTLMKNVILGRGVVGEACERSLYFVHYMLLRCSDLRDRCHTYHVATLLMGWGGRTCYYVTFLVEISGIVATSHAATLLMGWGGRGVNVPCTS